MQASQVAAVDTITDVLSSQRFSRAVAELRPHPQAGLIPDLDRASLEALAADVTERGIVDPLDVLADGTVVCGRQRLRAAIAARLDRVPVRVVAPKDPLEYMVRAELLRRNLTPSQRAALGIELAQYRAAQAAAQERQLASRAAPGERVGRKVVATLPPPIGKSRDVAARIVGVSPRLIQETLLVHRRDPERFAAVRAGRTTASAAAAAIRLADNRALAAATPSPLTHCAGQRYRTIVPDFPWGPDAGVTGVPYATMTLEQIAALQISELADPDGCHLYLWVTNQSLRAGFELLDGWGFRYITTITWCKTEDDRVQPSLGQGSYFRGSTEHLLFAVRGELPLLVHDLGTWFAAPRGSGGHSSKPERAYDIIRRASPGPRLELFARGRREGFTVWGAEASLPGEHRG